MVATTDQKARLHDLAVGVLEMVRDGKRDIEDVSNVLQIIKGDLGFALRLLGESDLLKFIGSVLVEGADRFVVRDCLKKANIGWTGENFNRLFAYKVEVGVPPAELNIHDLKKNSMDGPIIKELGGKEQVEIQLAHFLDFLSSRRDGRFIAYCMGLDGKVWAVDARWYSVSDWNVEAYSVVEDPYGWSEGYQVLSRKWGFGLSYP